MSEKERILSFPNVVAHGVDIVDTRDFACLVDKQAGWHLDRYFTTEELAAVSDAGNRAERLASRFAIKEAVLKALGTGWGDGIAFTDVEVVSLKSGAPTVVLHRRLVTLASERRIANWLVSASHTSTFAIASVIAVTA